MKHSPNISFNRLKHLVDGRHLSEALAIINDFDEDLSDLEILFIDLMKAKINEGRGLYKEAINMIDSIIPRFSKHSSLEGREYLIEALLTKANSRRKIGPMEDAWEDITKTQQILDTTETSDGVKSSQIMLNFTKGRIYWSSGDLEKTAQLFSECLVAAEAINDTFLITKLKNYIGLTRRQEGKLVEAEQLGLESLELSRKHQYLEDEGHVLENLAILELGKSNWEGALTYFQKSLAIREKIGNAEYTAYSAMHLTDLYLLRGDRDQSRIYLNKLERQVRMVDNVRTRQALKFMRGKYFKSGPRMSDKVEAQKVFMNLIEDLEIYRYFQIGALTELVELLVTELNAFGEEIVFREISDRLEQLSQISRTHKFVELPIQVKMIQARMKMIDLDFEGADQLFSSAIQDASEMKLIKLVEEIDLEATELQSTYADLRQKLGSNPTFAEKIERMAIAEYIKKVKNSIV